jgi:ketosteroid isomerase-like protein
MSQENVEVVRRVIEAWNRDDLDAMLAMHHPDLEYVTTGLFPGLDSIYHGHDGFIKYWQDFRDIWELITVETYELRDCGERVLNRLTFNARGRDGLEVRRKVASVATIRDGLIVRQENYGDWTAALKAVGLSEQDARADS